MCRKQPPFFSLIVTMSGWIGLASPVLGQIQRDIPALAAVYAQIGLAEGASQSATVGMTWPWPRSWQFDSRSLTGHWDAYLSHWRSYSATVAGSRESLTQIGLVPVFLWRFNQGRSAWFVEGGIGVSYTDSNYQTPDKRFSTCFNFADHLGLGVNFGAAGQQELALRLQHISNAAIRQPNPGENFIQLRYSRVY